MGNFGTTGEREVGVGPVLGFVASARARPTLPQWLFFPTSSRSESPLLFFLFGVAAGEPDCRRTKVQGFKVGLGVAGGGLAAGGGWASA